MANNKELAYSGVSNDWVGLLRTGTSRLLLDRPRTIAERRRMGIGELVGLVESIYALESNEHDWLRTIAENARAVFGGGDHGAYALTYDASDIFDCRFSRTVPVAIQDEEIRRMMLHDVGPAWQSQPRAVEAVFRNTPYGPARRLPVTGALRRLLERQARLGVEILGLNGVNVDGRGAHVGIVMRSPIGRVDPELLARVSSHLAAGFRLRARIGSGSRVDSAEAILATTGKIEHAIGDAKLRAAREALSAMVAQIERLKSSTRRFDSDRAIADWKALVRARWSLVDHFDRDGKRYLLAQRNDHNVGPIALLSTRETQVVALAATGHANKMIGYELGITASTVSVLLSRAAKKIGAGSRAELVQAYKARWRRKQRSGRVRPRSGA